MLKIGTYALDKKTNEKLRILRTSYFDIYLVKNQRGEETVKFKHELEKYNPVRWIWKEMKKRWKV